MVRAWQNAALEKRCVSANRPIRLIWMRSPPAWPRQLFGDDGGLRNGKACSNTNYHQQAGCLSAVLVDVMVIDWIPPPRELAG